MKPNNEKTSSNDSMEERIQPQSSSSEEQVDRAKDTDHSKAHYGNENPYQFFGTLNSDGTRNVDIRRRIRDAVYARRYYSLGLDAMKKLK